mgnify:CR=1 FL=1
MQVSETVIFTCANDNEIAQTVINTTFRKTCFSETIIFACANDDQVAQNLDFSCIFVLSDAKIIKKTLFSLHF